MNTLSLRRPLAAFTLIASAVLAGAPAAAQTNLLNNGGFDEDTGFLYPWSVQFGQGTFTDINEQFGQCVGGAPNQCLYVKDGPMSISQSFTAATGAVLDIDAYYSIAYTIPGSTFSVLLNGETLFSSDQSTGDGSVNQTLVPLHLTGLSVGAANTPGGNNTLTFMFNGNGGAAFVLDQVSVALAPVPEPASMALFAVGLAGLGVLRRRQMRA